MAAIEVDTSSPAEQTKDKPVVVRVKRKLNQERIDAFWLEITERPVKKPSLDLDKLSISNSSKEDIRSRKFFVQHIDTIGSSDGIKDVLHSLLPDASGSKDMQKKVEERRSFLKQEKKQDQLRTSARQNHENLARNARFEQIWKRRRAGMYTTDYPWSEICHLYDVVRVDNEKEQLEKVKPQSSLEDTTILCNYLPLLREHLPEAAAEIESDIMSDMMAFASSSREDDYVYDLYTVDDNLNGNEETDLSEYPRVKIDDDDDCYNGPLNSDYDTDDSNAEDNPLFDYPDEESLEENDQKGDDGLCEHSDSECEEEKSDEEENEQHWRWGYR